jgi:signal transduction histidine kinase/ActR/RegA family two-component response regulator
MRGVKWNDPVAAMCGEVGQGGEAGPAWGSVESCAAAGGTRPARERSLRDHEAGHRAHSALRAVVEGTSVATGEAFFPALAEHLASALGARHALVGAVEESNPGVIRTLAVVWNGRPAPNFTYVLEGTPCDTALARETVFVNGGAAAAFPRDVALREHGIEAYVGASIHDREGKKLGMVAVLNDAPLDPALAPEAILHIFADRAGAELQRIRADEAVRAMGEQLAHAQKMEGIGRLAGGVAHDFNNLLTVILSHAHLAEAELREGDPLRELVAPIREAAQRASTLTRQLLAFARRQVIQPRVVDLGVVVRDMSGLLQRVLGETIAVRSELADGLWPVRIDVGQLEQVLVNLAVNARDAMPGGGRLTIGAVNEPVAADGAARHGVASGDWVRLSVADTGHGMDAETLRRAFEPFFTTKGERGTGLGLATCHGIVQQAGGRIRVESAPGAGATFHLLLPRHTGAATAEPARPVRTLPLSRATVLVLEDEDSVRATAVRSLQRVGYRVLAAANGAEALRIADEAGRIDLLFTDVVLPGMGGREVAERLVAQQPGLRVLFATGYVDDETLLAAAVEGAATVLHKPYTPDALALRVSDVLARPATSPASSRAS